MAQEASRGRAANRAVTGQDLLREIGLALHHGRTVRVHGGGRIWPDTVQPAHEPSGPKPREEVTRHGQEARAPRSAGPAAGSRERTAGDSSAEAPGTPAAATSLIGASPLAPAEREGLVGAIAEYPLVVRAAPPGLWLSGPLRPVPGLADAAHVVLVYPFDHRLLVKAWAWWDVGIWIGPRHTNYGDGSICSYEVRDGTWERGKPLLGLLDLIAGWVTRHLHLRYFGFWPGPQVLHTAYERLREQRPGELCGACESGRPYEHCHREADQRLPIQAVVGGFRDRCGNGSRRPPKSATEIAFFASVPAGPTGELPSRFWHRPPVSGVRKAFLEVRRPT